MYVWVGGEVTHGTGADGTGRVVPLVGVKSPARHDALVLLGDAAGGQGEVVPSEGLPVLKAQPHTIVHIPACTHPVQRLPHVLTRLAEPHEPAIQNTVTLSPIVVGTADSPVQIMGRCTC